MVNVRKRGNVYEYNFNVAKIEGKRKRMKMVDGILEQQKLKVEKDKFILVHHLWKYYKFRCDRWNYRI